MGVGAGADSKPTMSGRNDEQLQVYNTLRKPAAKKAKARAAHGPSAPAAGKAAVSSNFPSREKEEEKPISCTQLVSISKLEVKERQLYVRFVLYLFFVFFFVRLSLENLGKFEPSAEAVQAWSGGAFPDVTTYKEGVAWIHQLRTKLYSEPPVPGTGVRTNAGELIPYAFGPISNFNFIVYVLLGMRWNETRREEKGREERRREANRREEKRREEEEEEKRREEKRRDRAQRLMYPSTASPPSRASAAASEQTATASSSRRTLMSLKNARSPTC